MSISGGVLSETVETPTSNNHVQNKYESVICSLQAAHPRHLYHLTLQPGNFIEFGGHGEVVLIGPKMIIKSV
jgi:hypothetical protein